VTCVLSRHPKFGGIANVGEGVRSLWAVPPVGSRGRAPGQGVLGAKPPEAGNFLLHK